eukprot:660306-Pleurochrysis_carterae.AAC.1
MSPWPSRSLWISSACAVTYLSASNASICMLCFVDAYALRVEAHAVLTHARYAYGCSIDNRHTA